MATLQVRSLDDNLYQALGRRAASQSRSISQEVVAILKAHLSNPGLRHAQATEALLQMAGTWNDERTPKEISQRIRKARRSPSRFRRVL